MVLLLTYLESHILPVSLLVSCFLSLSLSCAVYSYSVVLAINFLLNQNTPAMAIIRA